MKRCRWMSFLIVIVCVTLLFIGKSYLKYYSSTNLPNVARRTGLQHIKEAGFGHDPANDGSNLKPTGRHATSQTPMSTKRQQNNLKKGLNISMSLVVRMPANKKYITRFYCILLRSMALFWEVPFMKTKLVIVLDQESRSDHKFAQLVNHSKIGVKLGLPVEFHFETLPKTFKFKYGGPRQYIGYKRQLFSTFQFFKYSTDDVVAFTDTDAGFTTPITEDDILVDGKLKVTGFFRNIPAFGMTEWMNNVLDVLGFPLVANFMDYFPVYLWRDTYISCIAYMKKRHKCSTYEQTWLRINSVPWVSPVCVILAYAWHFERDRYDWHLDLDRSSINKGIIGKGQHFIRESDTIPTVHTAIQVVYYVNPDHDFVHPYLRGYCHVMLAIGKRDHIEPAYKSTCMKYVNRTNWDLMGFDKYQMNHMKFWCSPGKNRQRCEAVIREHYRSIGTALEKKYHRTNVVNLSRMVEKAAKDDWGVTCVALHESFRLQ